MSVPDLKESTKMILERAVRVASDILARKNVTFRVAESVDDARRIRSDQVERFAFEESFESAAAALLQTHPYWGDDVDLRAEAKAYAEVMCQFGDEHLYRKHRSDGEQYQLACGLDPSSVEAHWEVISAFCQGNKVDPDHALPYAVVLRSLDPARNEVDYVLTKAREYRLRPAQSGH